MDTFLESCVILGLVKDEGGTETTKTKPKTKKDIDKFVLTEAKLKESFERVATSYHPENPMFYQHNNTNAPNQEEIETIFRRILSSNHYLQKCLRHGLDTNQKASVYAEENRRFFNQRCFWDPRVDDDIIFIVDMTLFATKLKSIGLEKNDEIKSYIEIFCNQDDKDRAKKRLELDDAEWAKQKKRIIAEATENALLDGIKHWKKYGMKLLRLIAKESKLLLSNSTIQSMDEEDLIFVCMKPYAPLINKLCIVKGLISTTPSVTIWNNRTVLTTDYKIGMFI